MGHMEIVLEEFLKSKGISKNKVCENCQIQRTQLNNYCKNAVTRVDLAVLARLCSYLECRVEDIVVFKKDNPDVTRKDI